MNSQEAMELDEGRPEDGNSCSEPLMAWNMYSPRIYDYVLVADKVDDKTEPSYKKQEAFIEQLKGKKMQVNDVVHEEKVFYGIRAPKEIFEKYKYLLKVSDACNWSGEQGLLELDEDVGSEDFPQSTRIRVVHFVLHHTFLNSGENLSELLEQKVFDSMFCVHERKKQKALKRLWARWTAVFRNQPIDEIRVYFGEKVALYYLWLGCYTYLLVPASVVGIIIFLYGLAFFQTSPLITEVCESDIIMCPRCDKGCNAWNLSDTCAYAKVNHLFDNEGTVAFAMFMAIWATLFFEFWKRHRSKYVSKWKVFNWCEEEEEMILEVVNDEKCKPKEYHHSYWRTTLVLALSTLLLVVIIGLTHMLVVTRVVAAVQLAEAEWDFVSEYADMCAMLIGAVLHYVTMQVMSKVNKAAALKLCEIENCRSFAALEKSFTVKMFTFQFFTLFSSLIYIAFFLGRINGYPGNYVRLAGKWRLEECHPSGCLTDLFIQMAVILVLKQTVNNIFEFAVPWFKRCLKRAKAKKLERKCGHCYRKACRKEDPCDVCKLRDWIRNYHLNDVNAFSLFNEFLEMVLQFSFTTIFVAAFPLAPLLAFINNLFEIRLDAIKMVSLERRLVPQKTNDIGVWTKVLEAIGVLAVIANGLVIGFSTDFIPRLAYQYRYGPCANGTTDIHCMTGYINDTLATAYVTDEKVRSDFSFQQMVVNNVNYTHCRYKDYRSNEDQSLTPKFWFILAIRFAFVVLFEHVVVMCKFIAAWFIPDNPTSVKNSRLHDKLQRLKDELKGQKHHNAMSDGSTERSEFRLPVLFIFSEQQTGH
ncbi:anoctamin-9 isoform X2 [Denticeps clupeoides]|uniref:anoctamin-9 isoform X2 n=1 Tax=Denticeps clupeoides TaxID=299321 RepID=UPI0010A47C44|nr:anoctamin-9 isoform X2 [Denticeps clupeoides]